MSAELYTPVGVSAFSLIKPNAPADSPEDTDLFNGELHAIEAAFNQIHDLSPVTGAPGAALQLTDTVRNALVDLSPLKNGGFGNFVVVTLPPHPNVGDPPCFVIVKESGLQDDSVSREACVIVTTNDDYPIDETTPSRGQTPINGLIPDNVGYTNQIALFNPGDLARFVYIDPIQGWQVHTNLTIVVSDNWNLQAAGTFPWPLQHFHMQTYTAWNILPIAVYQPGAWFAMTWFGSVITIGDNTYLFNGVPGPWSPSVTYHRYRFTCVAPKVFVVQG